MQRPPTLPVVLAGGGNARLWPASKPFSPFAVDGLNRRSTATTELTPFRKAIERADRIGRRFAGTDDDRKRSTDDNYLQPLIVCGTAHRRSVESQIGDIGIGGVLLEPIGRDSLVAAAIAAHHAVELYGADVRLVLISVGNRVVPEPSSAVLDGIMDTAVSKADAGRIVVFSTSMAASDKSRPTTTADVPNDLSSWTAFSFLGFGRRSMPSTDPLGTRVLDTHFDRQQLPSLSAAANRSWHTGIVVCRAAILLAEIARLEPAAGEAAHQALKTAQATGFIRSTIPVFTVDRQSLARSPKVSLESFLERTRIGSTVDGSAIRWSVPPDWSMLDDAPKDSNGNVLAGEGVLSVGGTACRDNIVYADLTTTDGRPMPVAVVGVSNLVVAATDAGILVTTKTAAPEVYRIPNILAASNAAVADAEPLAGLPVSSSVTSASSSSSSSSSVPDRKQPEVVCPYGAWRVLLAADEGRRLGGAFQIKLLRVSPGGMLSLQTHAHRSENWFVASGSGIATVGTVNRPFREGDSIDIPVGAVHRLHNDGKVDLVVVEVQRGTYLGEDDTIRIDDKYGRIDQPVQPNLSLKIAGGPEPIIRVGPVFAVDNVKTPDYPTATITTGNPTPTQTPTPKTDAVLVRPIVPKNPVQSAGRRLSLMERALAPTIVSKPRTKTPPVINRSKPKPAVVSSTPRPNRPAVRTVDSDYDSKILAYCDNEFGRDALSIARHLSGPKATTILPMKINPILYRLQKADRLLFTQLKPTSTPIWRTKKTN